MDIINILRCWGEAKASGQEEKQLVKKHAVSQKQEGLWERIQLKRFEFQRALTDMLLLYIVTRAM